jgi:hypothetical protein
MSTSSSAASAGSGSPPGWDHPSPGTELGSGVATGVGQYVYPAKKGAEPPEMSLSEMMRLPTEEEKEEEAKMLREIDTITGTRREVDAARASRSRSGPGTPKEEITVEKEILVNQIDEYSRNFDDDSAAEVRRGMVTPKERKWSSASAAADNRMKFLTGRATAVRPRPHLRPLPKCIPEKSNKFYQALIHNRVFAQALIKRKVLTEGRSFDLIGPMWGCDDPYRVAIMNVLTQAERDVRHMDRAERETFRAMEAQNRLNDADAAVRKTEMEAAAGAGAGTAGRRRSIYTLRSKRRNVRNKTQRRAGKGLVRQGSRSHRKTRRRA